MGLAGPCVNRFSENTPIDFVVFVTDLGVSAPYNTYAWFYTCGQGDWGTIEYLKIWYDTDSDTWYDNASHQVGALSYDADPDHEDCGWWWAQIPNNWVAVGDPGNLFQISLTEPTRRADCVEVREGGLYMEEEVEEEEAFVPEPGTLMLLGSGLAGLAGYAGLRFRTRR